MRNTGLAILAVSMIALFSVTIVGCDDDSEDPKPTDKTDLEKVKEGIIGNWTLKSIAMTKDGVTETFNGGCDESGLSSWGQANAVDIDFNFTSATKVTEFLICTNMTVPATYTVTESSGKFRISTDNGFTFELITPAGSMSGSTVQANIITPKNAGISGAVWTFTK